LLRQRSETAASADDGDGLAGSGAGFLQALVHGDTGAEDGCDTIERNLLVETRDVGGFGDGVLLEGSIDGVAGEKRLEGS